VEVGAQRSEAPFPQFIRGVHRESGVLFPRFVAVISGKAFRTHSRREPMSIFGAKTQSSKYHAEITGDWPVKGPEAVTRASDDQLQQWASDPDCIEQEQSAAHLNWRVAERAKQKEQLAAKRQALQDNPFDPRTEVSADAKHIASRVVTHLWILFVALPLVLVLLYQMLK
jgi:hypothetical protein